MLEGYEVAFSSPMHGVDVRMGDYVYQGVGVTDMLINIDRPVCCPPVLSQRYISNADL